MVSLKALVAVVAINTISAVTAAPAPVPAPAPKAAEAAALAESAIIRFCSNVKFSGVCSFDSVELGNCKNVPNDWDNRISSIESLDRKHHKCTWYLQTTFPVPTIDILLKVGADVETSIAEENMTALRVAVAMQLEGPMGVLLQRRAILKACYQRGGALTIIIVACNADPRIAQMLIDRGANMMAATEDGETLMHSAALVENLETVKYQCIDVKT
ncbi:hypothetical protein AJ80_05621 [Polytolypa hystricis UAMH7299]|uniref:Uncharacterized protein n=1 Tax=Polytolypa hystricis (strain UAMH7299) TaxID=1447883 RepID=A0A2B7Y353_POLH7|nr:hypothetical protein AJ80_05621 [Polytolypa hystricis UAMH7299]